MKKYVLPTIVALMLNGGYVLADDSSETPPVSPAPKSMSQDYQEMMKQRLAEIEKHREQQIAEMERHRADMERHMKQQKAEMEKQKAQQETYMQEVQAIGEKLSQVKDSEERQRLLAEMEKKQKEMWQHLPRPFGMESRNDFGPPDSWGSPKNMDPRNNFGPPAGWNRPRGGMMPPQYGPGFGSHNMPYGRGMPPKRFNRNMHGGHRAQMEQHLENIENLLKEVVDLLKTK